MHGDPAERSAGAERPISSASSCPAAVSGVSLRHALKAQRARAAGGLRTSAAYARWEEIQLSDVKPVIEFTRDLTVAHPD